MKEKKSYTVSQAAEHLGISRSAVHKAIKTGRLKAKSAVLKLRSWAIDSVNLESFQVSESHQERVIKKSYQVDSKPNLIYTFLAQWAPVL